MAANTAYLRYLPSGNFHSESHGQFPPEWVVNLSRNDMVNFIGISNPDYEDDDENTQNLDLSAFTIVRWLSDEKTDREGIDDNDPLYKKLSPIRTRPGKLFKEWSDFKSSEDFRYCYREDEGIENWLTKFETWSDFDEDSNHSAFSSNGARLKMKRTILKDFLKDVQKDLIVMVDIKRYVERKEYGKYYPAYSRIYLFRADGRIETLEGNYRTW